MEIPPSEKKHQSSIIVMERLMCEMEISPSENISKF